MLHSECGHQKGGGGGGCHQILLSLVQAIAGNDHD